MRRIDQIRRQVLGGDPRPTIDFVDARYLLHAIERLVAMLEDIDEHPDACEVNSLDEAPTCTCTLVELLKEVRT